MPPAKLPKFRYHPDPIATGSVVKSDVVCERCGKARGFIYTGPVYAEEELVDCICPWCIADGSAHAEFDAHFVDPDGVGNHGAWGKVPRPTVEEVASRTPGFGGWQQEHWWTHCGDAAEFLGACGSAEAKALGPEFLAAVRAETDLKDPKDDPVWEAYVAALDRTRGPTAYAFRCRHCGKLGGYSDCH